MKKYMSFYNSLVEMTRNKDLYKNFSEQDTFSDRLIYFLLHFAFFLKVFKNNENKIILQEIYDYIFRQLELSIREIGYGDQSINKKMKVYLNVFHSMIDKFHNWESLSTELKESVIVDFLDKDIDSEFLVNYFDKYRLNLLKNTFNSHLKGVIKP